MSRFRSTGIEQVLTVKLIRFSDFEISWAGEGPGDQAFCFGSEDGQILLWEVGNSQEWGPVLVAETGEAVNGVAFLGVSIAVSTRDEVAFLKPRSLDIAGSEDEVSRYNGGAHGVIATRSGKFIAPLGVGGLLLTQPASGDFQEIKTLRAVGRAFNFYKAVSLGTIDQKDVLACAMRRDGLATIICGKEDGEFNTISYNNLDIIDISKIGSNAHPFAIAALRVDGAIHLFRDPINGGPSQTLRLDGIRETAYRVLSARGHIMVLTNRHLYTFYTLAARFLNGDSVIGPTRFGCIELEAVDASIAFDRWLLVVMPNGGAYPVTIDELAGMAGSPLTSAEIPFDGSEPDWVVSSHVGITSLSSHL